MPSTVCLLRFESDEIIVVSSELKLTWTMNNMKYKSNHIDYITKLGLTILLIATLLSPCFCAPKPWWYNPCDNPDVSLRHSRSADNKYDPVRVTLKQLIGQLNLSLRNIQHFYKKPKNIGKLPWIKSRKMLDNLKNPKNKLYEFHNALQFFAGALQTLTKMKVITNVTGFDAAKRRDIYKSVTLRLKSLLCEVEWSLEKKPRRIPLKKMGIKIPQINETSDASVIDPIFFKKMKSFFKKSQNILYRRKERKINNKTKKVPVQ